MKIPVVQCLLDVKSQKRAIRFKLIRTDTTLDLSQKAEKPYRYSACPISFISYFHFEYHGRKRLRYPVLQELNHTSYHNTESGWGYPGPQERLEYAEEKIRFSVLYELSRHETII